MSCSFGQITYVFSLLFLVILQDQIRSSFLVIFSSLEKYLLELRKIVVNLVINIFEIICKILTNFNKISRFENLISLSFQLCCKILYFYKFRLKYSVSSIAFCHLVPITKLISYSISTKRFPKI